MTKYAIYFNSINDSPKSSERFDNPLDALLFDVVEGDHSKLFHDAKVIHIYKIVNGKEKLVISIPSDMIIKRIN